jgi:hypothetical protein
VDGGAVRPPEAPHRAGLVVAAASSIAAENAKPGSTDWELNDGPRHIEGYADTTSAQLGDVVRLFVDTDAVSWRVEAYRMGWYGGADGRLVWQSPPQPGRHQPAATTDPSTHVTEARWQASLSVRVDADWPPGAYLLVLRSDNGGGHYVPLTVRDDASTAALVVMNAVTTWEAYNSWGGCNLYECSGVRGVKRADVVSFDRPYAHSYNNGSADFIDHELPLISLAEQLGLDVTYVTDVDVDRDPTLLGRHHGVVSLGHDEYYTSAMRDGVISARDHGVNLAFFGANAIYRHIRLEPSWDGRPRRREVNYRSMHDPVASRDPAEATVQWRNAPVPRPEAAIVGAQYACSPVSEDMRLINTTSWVFAGAGVTDATVLPKIVANEYDRVYTHVSFTPANLEILAQSPVTCRHKPDHANMTYYSAPSGAGVFDAGTIHWICTLNQLCPSTPAAEAVADTITENVLTAFGAGPAGVTHPSVGNVQSVLGDGPDPPASGGG